MRNLFAFLIAGIGWAIVPYRALAQDPPGAGTRAGDPATTIDAMALCGQLPSEPGERKRSGVHESLGGISAPGCAVTIRETSHGKTVVALLGFPRGQACPALQAARSQARTRKGGGMTGAAIDIPGARQAVSLTSPPRAEGAIIEFRTGGIMACMESYLVVGAVFEGGGAALEASMALIENRVRRTVAGLHGMAGPATLEGSEDRFLKGIFEPDESFLNRFGGKDGFEKALGNVKGWFEDQLGEDTPLATVGALSVLTYPSGERAFPSLEPVLPVITRLQERAETDPAAEIALNRFVRLIVRMDASGRSPDPAPAAPVP